MAQTGRDVWQAEKILLRGGLVAIPTETVYGLAGNALNIDSITKIFQVKKRPTFNPLIVHTGSIEKAKSLVIDFPPVAQKLAEHFWAGALTLLLPKQLIIPDLVTAGLDTVAIRIPNHPITLQLLTRLDFPLAAPSANPFGYISPTKPIHVKQQLGDRIAYILDGGDCKVGIESTIVGFENNQPVIFRLGGISVEKIEQVIGKVKVKSHSTSNPQSPGNLKSHYAPTKPLFINDIKPLLTRYRPHQIGALVFGEYLEEIPSKNQLNLSVAGDFLEATKNLFSMMRQLDKMAVKVIYATLLPEKNLGRAINDRLRRAAAQ
ncbi:MAG: L-threonylcarbamoyladenylate synthase [Bacteroidota bacterium]